jgi:hypothetical protein
LYHRRGRSDSTPPHQGQVERASQGYAWPRNPHGFCWSIR